MDVGHRERKREQTRHALIQSAYELFAERGYEHTTLADICAGANCSRRTFFRYFSGKEDLLLVGMEGLWAGLAAVLQRRAHDVTTLQALESWASETTQAFLEDREPLLRALDQERASGSLSAESRRALYSMTSMQAVLAPEFARDLGTAAESTGPRLLAAATAAVFDAFHTSDAPNEQDEIASLSVAIRLLTGAYEAVSVGARGHA